MRPYPATTPSPGYCCSCMPKSRHRCVTNLSTSSKEFLSSRSAIRSRAVSLPSARCRSRRSLPPPTWAARFISASCSTRDLAVTLAIPLLDYGNLLPVFQELFDTFVRERVLEQLVENLCRHRADVGAIEAGLHN